MRPNLGGADGDSACAVIGRRGVRVLLGESVNAATQRSDIYTQRNDTYIYIYIYIFIRIQVLRPLLENSSNLEDVGDVFQQGIQASPRLYSQGTEGVLTLGTGHWWRRIVQHKAEHSLSLRRMGTVPTRSASP